MTKSSLLLTSITLAVFGVSTMLGNPPWGAVTGIAILLTAAALGAGALSTNSRPENYTIERSVSSQRLSPGLAALSATAILAVYTAGYYRTRAAAEKIEAQAVRNKPAATLVAGTESQPPSPLVPSAQIPAQAQTNTTEARPRKSSKTPVSPAKIAKAQPSNLSSGAVSTSQTITPPPVASEPAPDATLKAAAPAEMYKDGTYSAWGTCRHGNLEASVVVEQGKIATTKITQCLTRYPCSWIANLPGQVVTRQSADVDYVSGATESTDAFYQAVAAALAKARE